MPDASAGAFRSRRSRRSRLVTRFQSRRQPISLDNIIDTHRTFAVFQHTIHIL